MTCETQKGGRMKALVVASGLLIAQLGTASANPGKPSAADIKLTKVVDGKKLKGTFSGFREPKSDTTILIYRDAAAKDDEPNIAVYSGSTSLLFEQPKNGAGTEEHTWNIQVEAPRARPLGEAVLFQNDKGKVQLVCNTDDWDDVATLEPLSPEATDAIVAKATFRTSAFVRRPTTLARDEFGTYYYVDQLRKDLGGQGYRVYVGKRGALKALPLVDVAIDDVGMVFATRNGNLRLTVDTARKGSPSAAVWAKGNKTVTLSPLSTTRSWYLIHRELGVYGAMGALCDDK